MAGNRRIGDLVAAGRKQPLDHMPLCNHHPPPQLCIPLVAAPARLRMHLHGFRIVRVRVLGPRHTLLELVRYRL